MKKISLLQGVIEEIVVVSGFVALLWFHARYDGIVQLVSEIGIMVCFMLVYEDSYTKQKKQVRKTLSDRLEGGSIVMGILNEHGSKWDTMTEEERYKIILQRAGTIDGVFFFDHIDVNKELDKQNKQ